MNRELGRLSDLHRRLCRLESRPTFELENELEKEGEEVTQPFGEIVDKAAKDLGLTLAPWQTVFIEQLFKHPGEVFIMPRQYGRTSINTVVTKIRELMNEPMKGRTHGKGHAPLDPLVTAALNNINGNNETFHYAIDSDPGLQAGWAKGGPIPPQVSQVKAWIDEGTPHAQVTVAQSDWDRLWRQNTFLRGEAEIMRNRITNQRKQLRSLNRTIILQEAQAIRASDAHKISMRVVEAKLDARNQTIARLELELNDAKQAAEHAERALAQTQEDAISANRYWSDLFDAVKSSKGGKKVLRRAIRKFDKKRKKQYKS